MVAASVGMGSAPGATQPGDHVCCGVHSDLSTVGVASAGGVTGKRQPLTLDPCFISQDSLEK